MHRFVVGALLLGPGSRRALEAEHGEHGDLALLAHARDAEREGAPAKRWLGEKAIHWLLLAAEAHPQAS